MLFNGKSLILNKQEVRNSAIYRRLLLDNNLGPIDRYATINEGRSNGAYEFDEVHLMKNAAVHIAAEETNVRMLVTKLFGDGSGLIHSHAQQTFILEYIEGGSGAFVAPVNFKTDEDSIIVLPSIVYVYGNGVQGRDATEVRALDLNGRLTSK